MVLFQFIKINNKIFKGIVEGVKAIHQNKYLHRDLKLKNILMHNNLPKIADFGTCKIL